MNNHISLKGIRRTNEDKHRIFNNGKIIIMYVCDGHGGGDVSNIVDIYLHKIFSSNDLMAIINKYGVSNFIYNTFNYIQMILENIYTTIANRQGTTCILSVCYNGKIYTANTGDSRGILCGHNNTITILSSDHKPTNTKEYDRIKKIGGENEIRYDMSDEVWRIKDLSLSRAFGDLYGRPFIIHNPDITITNYNKDDIIVLACDGLWDILSPQDVYVFIKHNKLSAKLLAHHALNLGSTDNVSIIIYKCE